MPNLSGNKRYMLKFQFARMQRPTASTWDCRNTDWTPEDAHPEVSLDVWNWLCGKESTPAVAVDAGAALTKLARGSESERLRAAYTLRGAGHDVVVQLLDMLRDEARAVEPRVEAKTADNAHGTNPTALRAAQALVAIGPAALSQLIDALADNHWLVRTAVADVRRVRRATLLALAQLRTYADGAEDALCQVLADEDRYNRFHAGNALRRIDHPNTREALLEALFTARWCPMTTTENMY